MVIVACRSSTDSAGSSQVSSSSRSAGEGGIAVVEGGEAGGEAVSGGEAAVEVWKALPLEMPAIRPSQESEGPLWRPFARSDVCSACRSMIGWEAGVAFCLGRSACTEFSHGDQAKQMSRHPLNSFYDVACLGRARVAGGRWLKPCAGASESCKQRRHNVWKKRYIVEDAAAYPGFASNCNAGKHAGQSHGHHQRTHGARQNLLCTERCWS